MRMTVAVGPDTRVVVAQSLGSVVACEALCANPMWTVTDFVTLGSPLGIPRVVFDRLCPEPVRPETASVIGVAAGRWPGSVRRWVNISDSADFVALQPALRVLFGERVVDVRIDNGVKAHAVQRYLSAAETGAAIMAGLRNRDD